MPTNPDDARAASPTTEPVPPPSPRRIGPYAVLQPLGEGGMGRVLLVEDEAGQKLALKVLAPWATDADARRFEREVRLLRGVRHPNVVGVLGDGVDPETGDPYLALELVPGRDLEGVLGARDEQAMPVEEATFVLERLARALVAIHALGIVHRDVKPANILIAPDGEVKLTDFGIALSNDRSTRITGPSEILGSVHYLAPEVIAADRITPAADLYALGALAFRLLAGEHVFGDRPANEVLRAHVQEPAPPLRRRCPTAPPGLAALVDRLLLKDPEERPVASEVVARLTPISADTSLIARLWTAEDAAARRRTISDRVRQDHLALQQYRIERELGRGGMGVVYLAYHLGLRREVALKTLLAGMLATDEERRRFLKEAEAAATLVHPNIVRVLDAGQVEGTYFLAMEYVPGRPLRELIREHPGDVERLLPLLIAVCDGVHHAHERGVVHRDLKPDNVLLDASGAPRVVDFGMAKRKSDRATATLTAEGDVIGTIRYMSPEQAAGRVADVDEKSDVWSLGAILYEMLTGTTPYVGGAQDVLVKIHLEDPPPPSARRPGVPWELDAIALKALERDRRERYPTARALQEDLQRFLDHVPILARRTSLTYRAKKWLVRNRREVRLAAAFAAALVLTMAGIDGARRERARRATVTRAALDGLRRLSDGDAVAAAAAFDRARATLGPDEAVPLPDEARPLLPPGSSETTLDAGTLSSWAALAEAHRAAEVTRGLTDRARAALSRQDLELATELLGKAALLAPGDEVLRGLREQTLRRCGRSARAALDRALDLPVAELDARERHLQVARATLELGARVGPREALAGTHARVEEERSALERDRVMARLTAETAVRRGLLARGLEVRGPAGTAVADGVAVAQVTVTVRDEGGRPRPDCVVRFEVDGDARLLAPETRSDETGTALAELVSTVAGVSTVSATVALGRDVVAAAERARVAFRPGPPDARASTLVAGSADAQADGAAVVSLTVTLRDRSGNPVQGARVELSATGHGNRLASPAAISGHDGVATGWLASTVAEVKTITAVAAVGPESGLRLDASAAVRFLPGPPDPSSSTVAVNPPAGLVANGARLCSVTVLVVDAHGNPLPGQTVKLESTGAGATLVQPSFPTGEDGVAVALLGSTVAEVKTVTAIVNPGSHQVALARAATVEFEPGPLDPDASAVQVLPGDGTASVLVVARDGLGNPIRGLRVELAAPGATLMQPEALTDERGEVRGALAWEAGRSMPLVTATVFTRDGPRRLGARAVAPLTGPTGGDAPRDRP